MTSHQAIAIRFNDGRAIEISEAFAYADNYCGDKCYVSPQEVIWEDGSFSFAKGWWGNPEAGYQHKLIRIGAGAYGDMTIIERSNERNVIFDLVQRKCGTIKGE